jgi:hypothetical protein
MLENPVCLPRIRRKQCQTGQPVFPRLPQIALGLQRLRFGREFVESLGMYQRMAFLAH